MGQFKFFSIALSMLLIGCATPPPKVNQHHPQGAFTDKTGNVYLSTIEPTNLDEILLKADDSAEIDTAKKIREYFCQASTQKRAIKYNLKLVMPKAEEGMATDEASKVLDMRMKSSRIMLKNFFAMAASSGPFIDLNLAIIGPPKDQSLGIKSTVNRLSGSDLISTGKTERIKQPFTDDNLSSYSKNFENKDEQALVGMILGGYASNPWDYSSRVLIHETIDDNILFVFIPSENTFYVVTQNGVFKGNDFSKLAREDHNSFLSSVQSALKYVGPKADRNKDAAITFKSAISPSKIQSEIDHDRNHYMDRNHNPRGFFVLTDGTSDLTLRPGLTAAVQPLSDAGQFELSILARNYLLVLPNEIQVELFGDKSGEASPAGQRYGIDDYSKEIVIKKVLQDSTRAWAHYLAASTTVKETPTSDPQVYNFQIELGLDAFCKYGRAKDELLSK